MLNSVITAIDSPMALLTLASVLAAQKNGSSWGSIDRIFAMIGLVFPNHGETRINADRPLLAWWWNEDEAIVAVGGIPNMTVGGALVSSYRSAYDPPYNSVFNSAMRQAGDWAVSILQDTPVPQIGRITYIGYSFGGGVATEIEWFFTSQRPSPDNNVVTFGTPACMRPSQAGRLTNVSRVALFTDVDPIPLLPPPASVCPAWYWGGSAVENARAQDWWYPGVRLQLDRDGGILEARDPSNAQTDWGLSMLGWVSGTMVQPVEGHEIQTYVTRLVRSALRSGDLVRRSDPQGVHLPLPPPPPPPPPPEGVIVPVPQEEITPRQNPPSSITLTGFAPSARYRARRDGTPWGVWYKDTPVLQLLRKKTARSLARRLNRLITPADRSAQIDVTRFLASMGEVLYAEPKGSV